MIESTHSACTCFTVFYMLTSDMQVNKDAFGDGWLMKVKVSDASEADSLLDKAAYEKLCDEKSH